MGSATGKPVLAAVKAISVPGLKVAAGGQVIEAAEGFSVGPATEVGVAAALIILLLTFGSLTAAGLPLITAGLALFTGVAVIELTTYLVDMPNVSTDLALMIGLGVGIDYSLFVVTRFREEYLASGDTESAVLNAMDTSGRAVLLAGVTVIIALLGMFATGVAFMYGLAIAAVIAVLLTVIAALTLLPAMLSRFGPRLARKGWIRRRLARNRPGPVAAEPAAAPAPARSRGFWRGWSRVVRDHPWPMAIISMLIMLLLLIPLNSLRLDSSDAGNDPANTSTRQAFDMLAAGFGPGFNGPLTIVTELPTPASQADLPALRTLVAATPGIIAVTPPRIAPSGTVAVMSAFPKSAPQDQTTTNLVNHLRGDVLPPFKRQTGVTVLVGGFTAGAIDFSNVLGNKLPLFIGIVIVLSALLLFFIFRSIVIPIQAAILNLLTIGAALGVTVAVFERGFASLLGVQKGPIEAWIPVMHVRGGVRPVDGLRGVPGLADPRGVGAPQRRLGGGRRGHRRHRARHQRRGGDHDLRVHVLHARQRAHAQGVRLRPGGGRSSRRDHRALPAVAVDPRAAGARHVVAAALARQADAVLQHRGIRRATAGCR